MLKVEGRRMKDEGVEHRAFLALSLNPNFAIDFITLALIIEVIAF